MENQKRFYKGDDLPHWIPEGKCIFITNRLNGTLPKSAIERIKASRDSANPSVSSLQNTHLTPKQLNTYTKYKHLLDTASTGPTWLANEKVAKAWLDALMYFNGTRYDVICSTVMPNHVHFILENLRHDYSKTMQSTKGFSARKSNVILGRAGTFWQHESYDHWIRSEKELFNTIRYTLENPVKAGFVEIGEITSLISCVKIIKSISRPFLKYKSS